MGSAVGSAVIPHSPRVRRPAALPRHRGRRAAYRTANRTAFRKCRKPGAVACRNAGLIAGSVCRCSKAAARRQLNRPAFLRGRCCIVTDRPRASRSVPRSAHRSSPALIVLVQARRKKQDRPRSIKSSFSWLRISRVKLTHSRCIHYHRHAPYRPRMPPGERRGASGVDERAFDGWPDAQAQCRPYPGFLTDLRYSLTPDASFVPMSDHRLCPRAAIPCNAVAKERHAINGNFYTQLAP